jgi:hypothetical protein
MRMRANDEFHAAQPTGGAVLWVAVFGYVAVCGILLMMR